LCASNEGDVILDPFVGGGTTVCVADKLKRNWIGIDQSVQAVKVTEMRLQKQQGLFSEPFVLKLHKYDYDSLRNKDAFAFETWIIEQFGGIPNIKQRNDLGVDGKTRENIPIQVKRKDDVNRNTVDNFKSACERFDKTLFLKNIEQQKPVGYIIAFSFGSGAIQEISRLKVEENVRIELVPVENIVPIAKKPRVTISVNDLGVDSKNLRKIEFIADGYSESGIEFYAWDFNYRDKKFTPSVLIDREGEQIQFFKAGKYKIACKVVDNEGLEGFEEFDLTVNGEVKKD